MNKFNEILSNHNSLSLSYISNNLPMSCGLWYAHSLEPTPFLYFLSSKDTKHGISLKEGKNVSFTIHKDDQNWITIKGLQGNGFCVPVKKNLEEKFGIYADKFPLINNSSLKDAIEAADLWEVKVKWIRIIDNSVSFGYKEEFNF